MRRWLMLLLLCLATFTSVSAKVKVDESSERKRPAWLGGYERNFIIKSAQGGSLDQAKAMVEASVKDEIARSVGEYINAADLTQIGQINGKVKNNYLSAINTQIAGIIRLTDVDMSQAKGFYWEHCRDTKTKQTYYEFHIRYPFSEAKRRQIVGCYEDMEQEIAAQITSYENALDTFTSYEELEANLGSLKVFYDHYKDNRRVQIRNIITRYLSVFQAMAIVATDKSDKQFNFEVQYKKRCISISSMPVIYVGLGNGVQKIGCMPTNSGWQFDIEHGQTYEIRFSLTYVKLNYKHVAK